MSLIPQKRYKIALFLVSLFQLSLARSENSQIEKLPITEPLEHQGTGLVLDTPEETLGSGRAALSLVLGSTIGLGLGQAVQGRYRDRGWLTIAEISALYIAAAGFVECDNGLNYLFGKNSGSTPINQNGCQLIKLGSFAYIGLRVFEVVDLVRFMPTIRRSESKKKEDAQEQPTTSATIFPTLNSAHIIFSTSF